MDGKIGTYLVIPSGIYGEAAGPVPALGVMQLIYQEKAQELGFVPYIGEGSARFNSLHVGAITPFMLKVLELALREESPQGTVHERCYAIGGKETPYKDIAAAYAKLFHAQGVIPQPEARSVSLEEAGVGELPMLMASDMRFVSNRAEALGYKNDEISLLDYLGRKC
jgi:nucleoside-diphosphate-sugar epimerase